MRSAGFPCRQAGCDRAFQVADQTSMAALQAASAARTAHEVNDHNYHHVSLGEDRPAGSYFRSKGKGLEAKPAQ
jgi:hypothetical protein